MTDRPPLNALSYLVFPDILLACILATKVPNIVKYGAFVVYSTITAKAMYATTGDGLQDYSMGSTFMGQFLTAVYLVFLVDPIREFRHKQDAVAPAAMPFFKRVYWALCIDHSPRGIGWNWQVANVSPPPTDTRPVFIRRQLLRAVRCFVLLDLAQSYIHMNPLFSRSGTEAQSIASQGYLLRCLNIVSWGSTPYGMVTMQYSLLAAIHVALGYSNPESWPDPYGAWSDAYTVRRFWGRTWHQMMRRYVSAYGKLVCRLLGIKQGTNTSSYTQLYVGFVVSGIMHSCGGDLMVGSKYIGASFPFFVLQPVAITIEDGVIALAKRWKFGNSSLLAYSVGYVWVFIWFSVSVPWYVDWAVRAGLGRSELLPISPARYVYNWILR